MTAFPKFEYVRSRNLLKAVASLPCQHCGRQGCTQAAHSNQSAHGKGRSIKASDVYTAALCHWANADPMRFHVLPPTPKPETGGPFAGLIR